MYEINTDQHNPVNFFAGDFPIVTAVGTVNTGKTIRKFEPVKIIDGKIEPVVKIAASAVDAENAIPAKTEAENTTENIYGIAADAATADEEVVIYLTGEFFADAITLPANVTIDTLKPAFRKLGIFLK